MAIGHSGGAYAKVESTPDYIGSAIQDVEQNAFKYREEQRVAVAKKKADADAESKDLAEHLSKYNVDLTGNQSVDDLTHTYAKDVFNRYADNVRKKHNTNDPRERQRIDLENARMDQSFDTLTQVPKMLNAKVQEIAQGVKEGKYNPKDVDSIQKMLGQLESGKAKLYIDETGQPRVNIYETDSEGNPTGVIAKEKTLAELVKSTEPHLASTYDKSILDITDKYNIDEKVSEAGGNKYTTQVKGKREDANAAAFADAVLGQPHNLYEISNRTGIPENDVEKMRTYIESDFKNRLAEKRKQEHDYSFDTEQRAKRKEAKEEIKTTVTNTNDVQLQDDFNKKEILVKGKKTLVNVPIDEKDLLPKHWTLSQPVKVKNIGGQLSGLSNAEITSVFLNDKGQVVVAGVAPKSKTGKSGTATRTKSYDEEGNEIVTTDNEVNTSAGEYGKFARRLTGETVGQVATALKYKNAETMIGDLKKLNEQEETETKQSSAKVQKGQVVEGYKFLGGDPSDANNWKKQ